MSRKLEFLVRAPQQNWQEILDALTARDVKILAFGTYSDATGNNLLLVTENETRTMAALNSIGLRWQSDSVVFLENAQRHGTSVTALGARLAQAGIGLIYSYASWIEEEGLFAVFKTADDERAMRFLEKLSAPPG